MLDNMCETLTQDRRDYIISTFPTKIEVEKISSFFATFSDNTRLRILILLSIQDMQVGDISELLSINQTTISHQLKSLKLQGMVTCDRNGKYIVYSLVDKSFVPVMNTVVDNLY